MGKARWVLIVILIGIILTFLGMSVPAMSSGELLWPVSTDEETTTTDPSLKELKKEVVPFPFGTTGFRSEESEVEETGVRELPLQRGLSRENQELVETTDASGGTMINLQGRFQCGLKVSPDTRDTSVEESLSPVAP